MIDALIAVSLCQWLMSPILINRGTLLGEGLQSGAAGCGKGCVTCFLRVPQAVRLNCSCHAAQASKGNFHKTCYKTFYSTAAPDCTILQRTNNKPLQVLDLFFIPLPEWPKVRKLLSRPWPQISQKWILRENTQVWSKKVHRPLVRVFIPEIRPQE